MLKLSSTESLSREKHGCHSYREGDWILFICTECDYIRQINYKTKETMCSGGRPDVIHAGMHQPTDEEMLKMN